MVQAKQLLKFERNPTNGLRYNCDTDDGRHTDDESIDDHDPHSMTPADTPKQS